MVPITRRASSPNKKMMYFLFNNKPILIRSMLAAVIVQDTFAGKLDKEEETTGGYFYRYIYWYFYRSGLKVFRFLALEFLSQNTHVRMGIRNRHTSCAHGYLKHIYLSRASIDMSK